MEELLLSLVTGAIAALVEVVVHRLADRYVPVPAAA
jgi:hypothetical protein